MYNKLKHTAMVLLPAVAALYVGLSQVWHFPHTEEVGASVAVVNTFLGALVALSTKQYNNSDAKYVGNLVRIETPDKVSYSLELNQDAPTLDKLDEATFKVTDTGTTPIVDQ